MIIVRGEAKDGKRDALVMFGLSHENIARMLKGEPVHVTRHSHGDGVPEGYEFVIFTGPTEEAMAEEIRRLQPNAPEYTMPRGVKDHRGK
ncbi:MAG TPA: hypothetical protein VFU31_30455 [Candidatus Binatia bacterium]|nr:hypothetical protein [Candidatus Binatia bacterium]